MTFDDLVSNNKNFNYFRIDEDGDEIFNWVKNETYTQFYRWLDIFPATYCRTTIVSNSN